jgi:acetyl esterase/lipase
MTTNRKAFNLITLPLICLFVMCGCQSPKEMESTERNITMDMSNPGSTEFAEVKSLVVIDNIAYRSGPSKSWRLDLAMPENFGGERHPAIVIIHGGGWRGGSKQDRPFRSMLLDYALKGYVTISVDYRLIGEAPLPACIEDVKCAVRWLRAHADQYHVDPDRIGAYGHSAGAHLAVMLALCPRSAGLEGGGGWDEFSSGVTSVVGGSTVTRVSERRGDPVKHAPATYITPDAPPILMIHGTADSAVDIETADTFVEQLIAAGVKDVGYVKVEGGSHGIVYEHHLTRTMGAMEKFFERTLKNK